MVDDGCPGVAEGPIPYQVTGRDCPEHGLQAHGSLYACPAYDGATLKAIAEAEALFREHLRDPAWIKANGLTPMQVEIWRWFAGIWG